MSGVDSDLLRRVSEIEWFHSFDLAPGIRTSGIYDPSRTLDRLALPQRLAGLSVLDVGAWDGFFSFEAERRGARVTATDSYSWGGPGWGSKAGFDLVHEVRESGVVPIEIDPTELDPGLVGGAFDIVLFLGVLYHLRDPLPVLERLRSVTAGMLILETENSMLLNRRPAAEFFPSNELNRDDSNWWAPNVAGTIGMLEAAGFSRVEVVWRRTLPSRVAKGIYRLVRPPRSSFIDSIQRDRFTFHAYP